MHFLPFIGFIGSTAGAMLIGAGVCHAVPRLGPTGRRVAESFCRAPGLDLVITYFTVLPLILGPVVGGWFGLLAAIIGQVIGLQVWEAIHEAVHRDAVQGPRIVK